MSQPIHHHQTFLHYTPPGVQHHPQPQHHPHQLNITHVAPNDTQAQSIQPTVVVPQHPVASTSAQAAASTPAAIIAKGDWTKDLVQLAKTAELKSVSLPKFFLKRLLILGQSAYSESMR
jgi:hypothetical protein